jgi:hypothetical protein
LDVVDKYSNTGRPRTLLIDKGIPPRMALYPIADRTDYVLHYLRVRMMEDFDIAADTGDFPVRWTKAVIWGLAADLSPEYGISLPERKTLRLEAEAFYQRAKSREREDTDENFILPAYTP